MKIISIILLLFSFQKVSYCLSNDKTLLRTCWVTFFSGSRQDHNCLKPYTHCNPDLRLCECDSEYPIPVRKLGNCLDYRKLGEVCLIGEQCSHINKTICFGGQHIDSLSKNSVEYYYQWRDYHKKFYGVCRCRGGYRQDGDNCYSIPNSHCVEKIDKCYCDQGYYFDDDNNQCRLITAKFGSVCVTDNECRYWDRNAECSRVSKCFCKKDYVFINNTQHCIKVVDCVWNRGYNFDRRSGECHIARHSNETANKNNKLILFIKVFVVMIILMIAILGNKYFWICLEDSQTVQPLQPLQSRTPHNFEDWVRRRRASRYRDRRLRQIRDCLDQLLPHNRWNPLPVTLPLTTRDSPTAPPPDDTLSTTPISSPSVPTVDILTIPSEDSRPPPYSNELPTYEEAMAVNTIHFE